MLLQLLIVICLYLVLGLGANHWSRACLDNLYTAATIITGIYHLPIIVKMKMASKQMKQFCCQREIY